MTKRKITNYVRDKLSLIRVEKQVTINLRGKGSVNFDLLNELIRLKKIFVR